MAKTNLDIRAYITAHGYTLGDVSEFLGISQPKFSVRYMMDELTEEDKVKLRSTVDRMAQDGYTRVQKKKKSHAASARRRA